MILSYPVEMPHIVSGRDTKGDYWTALVLPAPFARRLHEMGPSRRASVLRDLAKDMKRLA